MRGRGRRAHGIGGLLLAAVLLMLAMPAAAHELGMAVVVATPDPQAGAQARTWHVQVDTPVRAAGAIQLAVDAQCTRELQSRMPHKERVYRHWIYHCAQGWVGATVAVRGLGPAVPDALLQIRWPEGTAHLGLTRAQPEARLAATPTPVPVQRYLPLGVEHILGGWDHLLFVFLLWLCSPGWGLLWALTGFTLAHTVSLAGVLIGGWTLPAGPVEVLIALSLSLLAAELLRLRRPGVRPGLSLRQPVLMAFVFGLVHGLGFAGALAAIGLPAMAQWPALLLFNLGVELGQVGFALALVMLGVGARALAVPPAWRAAATYAALYAVGIAGMSWVGMRTLTLI
ncbi:MAG: HupE/UreJ family protein [Oceanococcaceae bacterium]